MKRSQTRKLINLSMLVAAGILMQLIESFFPVVMIVPGYKIGLANIAGLYALYAFGIKEMMAVTLLRVVLAGIASGTIFSVGFMLSVCGSTLAVLAMALAYKARIFSIYGVSTAGAGAHSLGQVLGVILIYQQYFMELFLPVLLALSIVSGLCIALLTLQLLKRLDPAGYRRALAAEKAD